MFGRVLNTPLELVQSLQERQDKVNYISLASFIPNIVQTATGFQYSDY